MLFSILQKSGLLAAQCLDKVGLLLFYTMRALRLYILFLLLCSAAQAGAQVGALDSAALQAADDSSSTEMEEVVVTGVTTPTRIQDALSTYRVISRAQAQAQGAVTLAEALRTQLNIQLSEDALLGTGMQLQGLRGDKVKILVDGIPVAGRENGQVDLGQLNLANVERIEVVQGPMSVVYGTDALGGVVNLITRKPRKDWTFSAGAHYEGIGRYNADGLASKKVNERNSITLGGGRNFFDGWQYIDTSTLRKRQMAFKPKMQYLANAAWNHSAPSGFKVQLASDAVREKVTNKGEIFPQPFFGTEAYAFDEYYRNTRVNSRLNIESPIGERGRMLLQNGHSYYHRIRENFRTDLLTMEQTVRPEPGLQDTTSFSEWTLRGAYSSAARKWKYTLGYDVGFQDGWSGKLAGGHSSQKEAAAYGQLSRTFFEGKLTLQGGVRGGYHSRYTPPVIPSFDVLYRASKKFRARASYARGFRAPSLKERFLEFIDQNHRIVGAEGLKAERSHHAQASISWDAVEAGRKTLRFTATGFFNDVTDGIALAATDPANPVSIDYTYANIARQQNAIGTVQAEWKRGAVDGQLGYSLQHTFAQQGDYDAFSASEVTANVRGTWQKFVLSIFYKFNGAQPALIPAIDGSASFGGRLPEFHMMDASLSRKLFTEKVQFVVGVKNIFNVQTVAATGSGATGIHTGNGNLSLLPRRVFATLRVELGG